MDNLKMVAVPADMCLCRVCGNPATRVTLELNGLESGKKRWYFHCDLHGKRPGSGLIPSEEVWLQEVNNPC